MPKVRTIAPPVLREQVPETYHEAARLDGLRPVRGQQPGTRALEVEALTVVDRGDALRTLPVAPAAVTVRAP